MPPRRARQFAGGRSRRGRRRRRHVAQYDIGRAAEFGLDGRRDSCVLNIGLQDRGSGYRRGLREIDPDDRAARADALDGDLGPAAGGATQIDHPAARQQQPRSSNSISLKAARDR
jgi:hypothetical protein